MFPWRLRALLAVIALGSAIGLSATLAGQSGAGASKNDIEWRFFGGDAGATRYSPANQIDPTNVRNLRVAWRWSARNFGPRPASTMQVSPLIVDGVMYTTAGINRDVVALDAASGQLLWHWRPTGELLRWFDIIDPLARTSGRGVSYWTDGRGDERIFVVMNSYMLVALDAKTGRSRREPALERAAGIASRRPGVQHVSRGHRRQRAGRIDLDAHRLYAESSQRVHQ
jgi:quinoprotein glucose dehydrogenase